MNRSILAVPLIDLEATVEALYEECLGCFMEGWDTDDSENLKADFRRVLLANKIEEK